MSAYYIFDVRLIADTDALDRYVEGVTATVKAHGGRYVVRGGTFDVVEGEWSPTLLVVIEFPTVDAARAWYESEEYRPLRQLRHDATVCDAVLVEGVDQHAAV